MGNIFTTTNKMAGKVNKTGKKKASLKKSSQTKSRVKVRLHTRVGLNFPCTRISRHCKKTRVAPKTGVFTSAVMEYIAAEVLELAGNAAKEKKKKTIFPKHLQTAIRNDEELNEFLKNVTIRSAHVLPHIEEALLPKKKHKVSQ